MTESSEIVMQLVLLCIFMLMIPDSFKVVNIAQSQFSAVVMLVGVSPPWCVYLMEDGG